MVSFDLGERFPRPRYQQRGSLRPRARRVAVLGRMREGVAPSFWGGPGCHPRKIFWDFWCQIQRLGQFGPENKLIEGQPKEYDVIWRNASVLAFHLWPTIFAGAPSRLQNIYRNGVPPRSRTTTLMRRIITVTVRTLTFFLHLPVRWNDRSEKWFKTICILIMYHTSVSDWSWRLYSRRKIKWPGVFQWWRFYALVKSLLVFY